MSDVNKGDDDPGASTVMFQRFVDDDGRGPGQVGRVQRTNRPVLMLAAAATLLVVLLVIVIVVAVVGS